MKKKNYNTLNLAIEEASRCLLCYDAPCSKACPAGIDISDFIRSLRFKNIIGAADTIRKNNPLASICSESYPKGKLSEGACIRGRLDRGIEISKLQSFLMKYTKDKLFINKNTMQKEKIAIFNSGPTALATAGYLLKEGYQVTLFEKESIIGDWLRDEISYEAIEDDLKYLKQLGMTVVTNYNFDPEKTIADLRKKEYKAIIINSLDYEYDKTDDLFPMPETNKNKEKILYSVKTGTLFAEEIIYNLNCDKLALKKNKKSEKKVGVI